MCLCCIVLLAQGLWAQQGQEPLRIPIDPKIRYGVLPNGLTYYIRHNELPKERAELYIVHNVGSMQEEDNQRGLAHFLEHMAFNGSTNFPDATRSMRDFTESIGMRFGENLNAYTSFDETVYMLMNAPVTSEKVIDTCLLILHDWSSFLTLADSSVEKERGVIREEWRTGSDAQSRLWEQQLPKMYPGSRYAYMPIGKIEVIDHFQPDELRDYYKKWYRPDLQAVIIVGDIQVDEVEKAIQTIFADIPSPVNSPKREPSLVPDNDEPLVSIATDKESTNTILSIYYKHDKVPDDLKESVEEYVIHYMQSVISAVMNERFGEMLQKANPPFVYAYAGDGDYMIAKTKGAWTSAALLKPDGIDAAMNALVTETNRAKQFGFTAAEYDRARTNILKSMESAYKERDNQKSVSYAEEYIRHFTDQECIPGIEMEYQMLQQIAPAIPVESINRYIQGIIGDNNIVISLMGPDNRTYPSETELLDMFRQAKSLSVEAYQEEVSDEPLISALPAPGKIVQTKEDPLFGTTIYTLSNGVKVVLKETDFKKDQILMRGSSPGGSTLFGEKDAYNLKIYNNVSDLGGLGDFSVTMLGKMLTGKSVSCETYLGDDFENITGSSVPSDIRTLFELIYLTFTAPRSDEEAYASFEERVRGQLENMKLNPMVVFSDTITNGIYDNHVRAKNLELEDLQKISYERIVSMYKERYADASDFTFTFVGNIEKDSMIPMMEQYLATLPSLKRIEKGDAKQLPVFRKGNYANHFHRTMETPKATILNIYSGQMNYDAKDKHCASILKQILDLVYTEKVRENESGSYGVNTAIDISIFPKGLTTIQIYFDTNPEIKDKLMDIVKNELQEIVKNGPREADFTKTRDNMIKRHDEAVQDNSYWMSILDDYYFRGYDWHTGYKDTLEKMKPADVQSFAKKLLDQGNHVEIMMEP
ncbi:MAG: insulinase family protein [Tannerella sp.]|jgi:zinc protease|nr:insulinase family protein [Tannerella sp.]